MYIVIAENIFILLHIEHKCLIIFINVYFSLLLLKHFMMHFYYTLVFIFNIVALNKYEMLAHI